MIMPRLEQEYYKPYIAISDLTLTNSLIQEYLKMINSLDISYTNKDDYHDLSYHLSTLISNMTSADANSFENYIKKE